MKESETCEKKNVLVKLTFSESIPGSQKTREYVIRKIMYDMITIIPTFNTIL